MQSMGCCRARGVSLLEVTISVVILAIAVVGLSAALASTSHLDAQSRERLLAINAAREALDTIRAQPYRVITANNGKEFEVLGLQPISGEQQPGKLK